MNEQKEPEIEIPEEKEELRSYAKTEGLGTIYDKHKNLTHIIHFNERSHRPEIFKVDRLSLDDIVELFND